MAQHRATRTPRTLSRNARRAILWMVGAAILAALYVIGAHAQASDQAPTSAPSVPLCTQWEISMADASHAYGHDLRLACDDAESLGLPVGSVATETVTPAPTTVTTTAEAPVVTSTEVPAPVTVVTTELPAPVVQTVTEAPVVTTETEVPAPVTETVTVSPDVQTVTATEAPPMAACTYEDGSAPDQTFPCLWDGATMGNGQGDTYILTESL